MVFAQQAPCKELQSEGNTRQQQTCRDGEINDLVYIPHKNIL